MPYSNIITGCSCNGLADAFSASVGDASIEAGFYLADVVLPIKYGGTILSCDKAEESRIDSGLYWPPEARVDLSRLARRIPVSLAWKLLIDSGQDNAYWKTGINYSCPIAKIVATHIASRLKMWGAYSPNCVISIPNDLDEYGQEILIRELISLGIGSRAKRPTLLWRPVAAALSWLSCVQNKFENNIPKDDYILTIYIGPDAFEIVPFALRTRRCSDEQYVIPLRESPKNHIAVAGVDIAAAAISRIAPPQDYGAFWQAFTGFPDVWLAIAGRQISPNELPRLWNRHDGWQFWNPNISELHWPWHTELNESEQLHNIVARSVERYSVNTSREPILNMLCDGAIKSCKQYNGKLRGVIAHGPMLSADLIKEIILRMNDSLPNEPLPFKDRPEANSVWFSTDDITARGALIYGERRSNELPTYLDTLPQMDTYAKIRGIPRWVPLLKKSELEIEGGKSHRNTIKECFLLRGSKRSIEVRLRKENKGKSTMFQFPYPPQDDTVLDLSITMSPASGLANMEFIPEDKTFLKGKRLHLDYSKMDDLDLTAPLLESEVGFPRIVSIAVDPDDGFLSMQQSRIMKFLDTDISHRTYLELLEDVRNCIRSPRGIMDSPGKWLNVRFVNQDGLPGKIENHDFIKRISQKFGDDLTEVLQGRLDRNPEKKIKVGQYLVQAGSWLFAGIPESVKEYIILVLDKCEHETKTYLIQAAGRCFTKDVEFERFYKTIIACIKMNKFNNNHSRALYNLLQYREYAPDSMKHDKSVPIRFVKKTLDIMDECRKDGNYKNKFMQAVRLFVVLLRYRVVENSFLSHDNRDDRRIFDGIKFNLECAKTHYHRGRGTRREERIAELLEQIKNYMDYKGTDSGILDLLGEGDDDDE